MNTYLVEKRLMTSPDDERFSLLFRQVLSKILGNAISLENLEELLLSNSEFDQMLEELDKHNITLEIRSLGLRSDDIDHRARIYSIFHQKRAKESNIPLRNSGTFPKRRRGPVPYGYIRIDSKRDIVIPDFPVVPAR